MPLRGGGGSYIIGQCKGWAEYTKAELRDASVEVVKVPRVVAGIALKIGAASQSRFWVQSGKFESLS